MSIAILLALVGSTLFVGMFMAIFLAYRDAEAERRGTVRIHVARPVEAPSFFGQSANDVSPAVALRQIEHHLRHEHKVATLFVDSPCADNLWLGRQQVA